MVFFSYRQGMDQSITLREQLRLQNLITESLLSSTFAVFLGL